jgi:HPt (histidine-containing phosphotransfer) domain-containing protein
MAPNVLFAVLIEVYNMADDSISLVDRDFSPTKPSHQVMPVSAPQSSVREATPAAPAQSSRVRIDATVVADLREISEQCGYDVLRQAAEIFFSEVPQRIADLRATASAHDAARAVQLAHQLKGAAACVGVIGVRELCAEIEASGRKGNLDAVEALLCSIESEVSAAREVLLGQDEKAGT